MVFEMGRKLKIIGILLLLLLLLSGSGFVLYRYYSYFFSRTVTGLIVNVESATPAASRDTMTFAVAIQTRGGEIVTGASNDREWAVARPGLCARARFFPYPPWQLDKAGTYFNVRLLKLFVCHETSPLLKEAPLTLIPPKPSPVQPKSSTKKNAGKNKLPKTTGEKGRKGS